MSGRDRVRFCNNPVCERCDEHLRSGEALRKAAREVCPACLEPLVVQEARPRAPRLPTRTPRDARPLGRVKEPSHMSPARKPVAAREPKAAAASSGVDAKVRERIHLEILRRTGAYRTDDHFLLPSGHHAPEFIDKALVTTEPSFSEGLGAIIAKHFAPWPVDVVLSTGPGALILAHCVARALPARPVLAYATKEAAGSQRRVRLVDEFARFVTRGTKVLVVEDLITTGETIKLLLRLVEESGGSAVGVGCLWQRDSKVALPVEVFSLVTRDFPTYDPRSCALCREGRPLNVEFARAEPPVEEGTDPPRPSPRG